MNIEFRFNGAQQIILIPENNKDKQLLHLFCGENKSIKMVPPKSEMVDSLIIESFTEQQTYLENPT